MATGSIYMSGLGSSGSDLLDYCASRSLSLHDNGFLWGTWAAESILGMMIFSTLVWFRFGILGRLHRSPSKHGCFFGVSAILMAVFYYRFHVFSGDVRF